MNTIPEQYRSDWSPWYTEGLLIHITKKEHWEEIQKHGALEPRDPNPQHWAGMKAIFFFDEDHALTPEALEKMRAHVKKSGEQLVRLYIKTANQIYQSTTSDRAFHIMTLDPIPLKEIIKSEIVE